MRIQLIALAALALPLAACGSDDSVAQVDSGDSISMKEVAERAQDSGMKPEPGEYSVKMEVLEVNMPGAPAGMADMMSKMMAGQTHKYCLTQEDVDKGFEKMARQSQDGDCTFQRFDVNGGDFDGQMTCNKTGQGMMTMTMNGHGTPTRSEMDMTMKGNFTGMGNSTIHMKATHERIGDCS